MVIQESEESVITHMLENGQMIQDNLQLELCSVFRK